MAETTTSHYMRYWNLYIMNELKEENLLNNYLDIINPRMFRQFLKRVVGSKSRSYIRIKNLRSTINMKIKYNNNFLNTITRGSAKRIIFNH